MILLLILALSTNKLESPKERTVPHLAPSATRMSLLEPPPLPEVGPHVGSVGRDVPYPLMPPEVDVNYKRILSSTGVVELANGALATTPISPSDYPNGNQAVLAAATQGYPTNAVLIWDAVPLVVGYNVYRGTNSRAYGIPFFTPGTNATYALIQNATNYFAVTALDSRGAESDFSNEVSYKAVAPPPPVTNFAIITWASSNMVTWKNIGTLVVTNSEPFQYFKQQIIKIVP